MRYMLDDFGLVLLFPWVLLETSSSHHCPCLLCRHWHLERGGKLKRSFGCGSSWSSDAFSLFLPHQPAEHFVIALQGCPWVFTHRKPKGESLHPDTPAKSQCCNLASLKLCAQWAFARSHLWMNKVAGLRSWRCPVRKGQQVSGSVLPFLCPLSHFLKRDESLFPFGSYHPPCCFSEMQPPSSDVVYFLVMQFSSLFLLGAALPSCF